MIFSETAVRFERWNAASETDYRAVRGQLDRLLANPLFNHSKRYPAFLRYVVEQTLSGQAEDIKERTIAIGVFERTNDYDTNADPIVRVTAGEVRKRLAQYYYEEGHEAEIRIELPVGSYVPLFYLPVSLIPSPNGKAQIVAPPYAQRPSEMPLATDAVEKADNAGVAKVASSATESGKSGKIRWAAWLAIPALAVCAVLFPSLRGSAKPSQRFDQFWSQVAGADGSVQFCFGTFSPATRGVPVTMSSVGTMIRIRDILDERKKTSLNVALVLGSDPPDLTQFHGGPVIFVGPYMPVRGLIESLRYSFISDDLGVWIRDQQAPSEHMWRTDYPSVPVEETSESYAIVARLFDRNLKRPIIIVAGVSPPGTVAAGEVLVNPEYMEALLRETPNWKNMNFEAVVKTRVMAGKPGPPQIVATHFWQ